MYNYVKDATVKPFRNFCSDKMNQVKQFLKTDFDLDSTFYLIGSGAKNLVTQNENNPFDLDYNIEINNLRMNAENAKKVKNAIMNFLNEIMENTPFSDSQDSTSVITSSWKNDNGIKFSFDICVLAKNSIGNYCRMKHDKYQNRYYWEEVPNSTEVYKKMELLKKNKWWQEVRKTYLNKKNMYLKRNDYNHPSFVIFVETINEVYYMACHR